MYCLYTERSCAEYNEKSAADSIWKEGAFASVMQKYNNYVLSDKQSVSAGNFFKLTCVVEALQYNPQGIQIMYWSPDEALQDLVVNHRPIIGDKETKLLFFNAFSNENCNMFVLQQKHNQRQHWKNL